MRIEKTKSENNKYNVTIKNENIIELLNNISNYPLNESLRKCVDNKIKKLLAQYNNDIEEIKQEEGKIVLKLDKKDERMLSIRLRVDLDEILNSLETLSNSYTAYKQMLSIINNCENGIDTDDEIYKMIDNIKNGVLPNLNNKELENELSNILTFEKDNLNKYLDSDDYDYLLENKKDIQRLEKEFRRILHTYLIKLNNFTINLDIEKNIISEYNDIEIVGQETYKSNITKYYLDKIYEISRKIKNKYPNCDEVDAILFKIQEFDFNKLDLKNSSDILTATIKKLYSIQASYELEETRIFNLADYQVKEDDNLKQGNSCNINDLLVQSDIKKLEDNLSKYSNIINKIKFIKNPNSSEPVNIFGYYFDYSGDRDFEILITINSKVNNKSFIKKNKSNNEWKFIYYQHLGNEIDSISDVEYDYNEINSFPLDEETITCIEKFIEQDKDAVKVFEIYKNNMHLNYNHTEWKDLTDELVLYPNEKYLWKEKIWKKMNF